MYPQYYGKNWSATRHTTHAHITPKKKKSKWSHYSPWLNKDDVFEGRGINWIDWWKMKFGHIVSIKYYRNLIGFSSLGIISFVQQYAKSTLFSKQIGGHTPLKLQEKVGWGWEAQFPERCWNILSSYILLMEHLFWHACVSLTTVLCVINHHGDQNSSVYIFHWHSLCPC